MIQFIYHEALQKDIAKLEKRYRTLDDGFKAFERLCEVQFSPDDPRQVIAPAKLHRVIQNDMWAMWKVELIIPKSGLRPNQYPRMWFAVKGTIIVFVCIATHVDNYRDDDMNRLALARLGDIL